MVSSDLGACEWFVWDLRRSGLIDRGQLDQVVGEFLKRNPRAEPPALAEFLVGQSVLSPFQSERILQGKTQGLVLGPYILMDSIGAGSMGQVYKASSKTDNQLYAVKVLPRRSMWNVRLARRQVRAFSQFTHPAVVPFIDVGTSGGLHYLVWPLVDGETLEVKLLRESRLSPDAVAHIGTQIAQGLASSHQHGLFHGFLKPSNVMIGADGQSRILDYGIGSLLAENEGESLVDTMSTANTLTSGLDCASPESIMEPTNRTPAGDQYSLGCVLYYCLSGRYPFADGTAVEKMMAHQFKQPTPIREVAPQTPDGLVAVIERLMQKSPESRYPGADEIVNALQPYLPEVTRRGPGFGGGSHHGGLRSSTSNHGTRPKSTLQAPARSAPSLPPQYPVESAQLPTPPSGPLTPPPSTSPFAVPASPLLSRGALPQQPSRATRANFTIPSVLPPSAFPVKAMPAGTIPEAVPVADTPIPAHLRPVATGTAPGWVDQPKTPVVGPLLIFLVAALVTGIVYLLGKNFLFPN